MRLIYKRFSVVGGFIVLLAVLAANSIVTRHQLTIQDNNQQWVEHTQQVLLELGVIESLIKDAETGQRGFLYTGAPEYLAPYNAALPQLDPHLKRLEQLTVDNSGQQARIAILRRLIKQKMDELAQTIDYVQAGQPEDAKALVLANLGKVIMENIGDVAQDIRQDENSLLAERLREVNASTLALVRTIYIASALAVIGLVLLAYYILREFGLREKHASEIREREEWFRVTLSSIGDAVIATNEQGAVTFLNRIAEDLTGFVLHSIQGQPIQKVFPIFNEMTHVPVENPVAKVLQEGRIMGLANHTVLQRRDGKLIPIEDSAAPIYDDQRKLRGVVMVFRDVTAEKQIQEVMRKTEKLAAASRLAASVAHEINNPLEAVCNLVYIVKNSSGLTDEARAYLTMAEQELDRVSHVTRQTLGFYRDPAGPIDVDIPALVQSVMKLYENKIVSKRISLEMDLHPCSPLRGMQGELKQLMANLVVNAVDAVSQGGKIRISVWPAVYEKGRGIEIRVADDGPGISLENQARLFEPFFTTKQDIGTGLGLWVSKEIADRHLGTIHAATGGENSLGGAVFSVFLRGVSEAAEALGAA